MEGARTRRKRLDIPRLVKGVHFLQQRTERPDVLGGGIADNGGQCQHFQGVPDGVDLLDVRDGKGAHHHAPSDDIFHQPVTFQLAQGLAQRRAADVHAFGIFGLHNARTCGNLPGDDRVFQGFVCHLADRLTFH